MPLPKPVSLLKNYLDRNPEVREYYVNFGLATAHFIVTPVNSLLKHLIEIQGLDINTVPGLKAQRELQQAMDMVFDSKHDKFPDTVYDHAWVQQKFTELRNKRAFAHLAQDQIVEMTDVSHADSSAPVENKEEFSRFEEVTTPEIFTSTSDFSPEDELKALLADDDVEQPTTNVFQGNISNPTSVKSALEEISKFADKLESFADAIHPNEETVTKELGPDEIKELVERGKRLKNIRESLEQYRTTSSRPNRKTRKAQVVKVAKSEEWLKSTKKSSANRGKVSRTKRR